MRPLINNKGLSEDTTKTLRSQRLRNVGTVIFSVGSGFRMISCPSEQCFLCGNHWHSERERICNWLLIATVRRVSEQAQSTVCRPYISRTTLQLVIGTKASEDRKDAIRATEYGHMTPYKKLVLEIGREKRA